MIIQIPFSSKYNSHIIMSTLAPVLNAVSLDFIIYRLTCCSPSTVHSITILYHTDLPTVAPVLYTEFLQDPPQFSSGLPEHFLLQSLSGFCPYVPYSLLQKHCHEYCRPAYLKPANFDNYYITLRF